MQSATSSSATRVVAQGCAYYAVCVQQSKATESAVIDSYTVLAPAQNLLNVCLTAITS
ncbi:hypothetical protein Plhal304r1_c026g0086891 [Plasmopara halstedii]